jgi:photosystem II stability/assembly factor-like uncharacterized protein
MRIRNIIIVACSVFAFAALQAPGAYDHLIRVYYDSAPSRLANTSFVPYAAYEDYAVGEVSVGYGERLKARGFRFDVIAEDPSQKNIWEVRLPVAALPAAADVLLTFGPSRYIVATPKDVDVVAGDRARRLRPIAVDFEAFAKKPRPVAFEARNEVAEIVAAVNRGRYERTVRDLVAFGTRYSYSFKCKQAADYIEDALSAVNLDVKRDRYFGPELKRVAAANGDVAWAAGELGVVAKTTDGGKRWRVITRAGGDELSALACASADVAWLGGAGGVIWRTRDGGLTWDKRTITQDAITDLYFLDGRRGWAVTSYGAVFRTLDGGDNWQRLSVVGEWLWGVSFSDGNNGLICGAEGYLARTTDGGASWKRVGAPPKLKLEAVAHRNAAEAYVVGEDGTVLRSADGGATWAPLELRTGTLLRNVEFAGNYGYIVGGVGGFWRTRDGSSWQKKAAPKYVLYSVAAAPPEVLWCGAGGGALLYSPDGGDSWKDHAANADPTSEFVWDNVWAIQPGRGDVAGTVLVCAHYDSLSNLSNLERPDAPAPGADDNATGTAAVIEFARASRNHAYRRDVIYICYSGEEEGLLGSSHFVSRMATAGEPLLGVLNMDMLGYADKLPEDLDIFTDRRSAWLAEYARAAATTYVAGLGVDVTVDERMWFSDHKSFWDFGYTATLAIEDWPLVYKHGHTSKDTPDKLNFDIATSMTRGVVAAAASLASPTSVPVISSLDAVKVYPNPYKSGKHEGRVYFADLPPYSKIKFYNVAGELVYEGANGPKPLWALKLELEPKTVTIKSSGVYLYVIEAPSGERKIGKLAVIR